MTERVLNFKHGKHTPKETVGPLKPAVSACSVSGRPRGSLPTLALMHLTSPVVREAEAE